MSNKNPLASPAISDLSPPVEVKGGDTADVRGDFGRDMFHQEGPGGHEHDRAQNTPSKY